MGKILYILCVIILQFHGWFPLSASHCQKKVESPAVQANLTCDNKLQVFSDGKQIGQESIGFKVVTHYAIPRNARVLAVKCHSGIKKLSTNGGIVGSLSSGILTDTKWKCSNTAQRGWTEGNFDDSSWPNAVKHGENSHDAMKSFPWGFVDNVAIGSLWIWTKDNKKNDSTVYCRIRLANDTKECFEDRNIDLYRIENGYINRSLNGSVVLRKNTSSSLECAILCQRNPYCSSFNYENMSSRKELKRLCELNSKTIRNSDNLVFRKGFTYFDSIVD